MNYKNFTCTQCNESNVAIIFWGYPADIDWYLKAIDDKGIIPGGCLVLDNDPKLEYSDCLHQWGTRYEDED
jgi:hypothetical protein